jgi:hypothetical protein
VLVKGASEVSIKQMAITQCLPDNTPHEFEIIQMIGIDATVGIGLERHIIVGGREQTVIHVKDLFRQKAEPLSREPSSINAFFSVKSYIQAAPHLICAAKSEFLKGIFHNRRSSGNNSQGSIGSTGTLLQLFQFQLEILPLDVEVQQGAASRNENQGRKSSLQQRHILPQNKIEKRLVRISKVDETVRFGPFNDVHLHIQEGCVLPESKSRDIRLRYGQGTALLTTSRSRQVTSTAARW